MPSVLPFVSQPSPRNGSYKIPTENLMVNWIPSRNATASLVYFSKNGSPEFVVNQKEHVFKVGALEPKTTYYWRIGEIVDRDTVKGAVWHFTTR